MIESDTNFDLPRVSAIAVREYVPGNLIYAHGQRFVPRRYTWETGESEREAVRFKVHVQRGAVSVVNNSGGFAGVVVTSMPICDVTLVHRSRISDKEKNRFQMGVAIYGRELGRWSGGSAYT